MKLRLTCASFAFALLALCSALPEGTASAAAATPPPDNGYTATKYPIVLVHGFMGFRELLGAVEYFPGIPEALEEGGAKVYLITSSHANTSQVRGEQLIPQLERIRAATGATKFNLIGHSQGSMDSRYIAAVRPDLVASVTSVGGPHQGSPVADFILSIPFGSEAIGGFADLFKLISGSSNPNDGRSTIEFLSPAGATAFALKYPAGLPTTRCGDGEHVVSGIRYYSWGGTGQMTNPVDLLDPLWVLLGLRFTEANDGLVGRCSSHLGEVIRDDYFENHIDESNLMFGFVSPLGPNPKTLYRNQVNRLKNAGL